MLTHISLPLTLHLSLSLYRPFSFLSVCLFLSCFAWQRASGYDSKPLPSSRGTLSKRCDRCDLYQGLTGVLGRERERERQRETDRESERAAARPDLGSLAA